MGDLRAAEEECGEHPTPRFFYDRGELELVSSSTKHEGIGRIIAQLALELATEFEIDAFDAGQTTFKREDLELVLQG